MRVIWGEGLTDESNLGGSNQTFTNNVEKNRSGHKGSIRKKTVLREVSEKKRYFYGQADHKG